MGMAPIMVEQKTEMSDFNEVNNWEKYPEIERDIIWHNGSGENGITFVAEVETETWYIRINNFPDEPLYTLIIIIRYYKFTAGQRSLQAFSSSQGTPSSPVKGFNLIFPHSDLILL